MAEKSSWPGGVPNWVVGLVAFVVILIGGTLMLRNKSDVPWLPRELTEPNPADDWRQNPPLRIELVRLGEQGPQFVSVAFAVTNTSSRPVHLSEASFTVLDRNGKELASERQYVVSEDLPSGETARNNYVVRVDDSSAAADVVFAIERLEWGD